MSSAFALARAKKALSDAGIDPQVSLVRASSVTNEVWISERYVIRVNRTLDQRLRREAFLGPLLPEEVGYPEVVAYGGELGADYLIVKRMPGQVLSRWWPTMEDEQREDAVRQVTRKLKALHRFETPAELSEIESPHLLGGPKASNPIEPLLDALDKAGELPHVRLDLLDRARSMVMATCDSLDGFVASTLIHGDLHFENVLWDGEQVTGLLDFEWAHTAPPDLELDIFLRFCSFPYLHVAEDYEHLTVPEDYALVPYWVADEYPELFAHDHLLERLRIYCISYDLRELLLFPPPAPVDQLSKHHPYNRLKRVVQQRSHLDDLAHMPDSPIYGGHVAPPTDIVF